MRELAMHHVVVLSVASLLVLVAPASAAHVWVVAPSPAPGVDFLALQPAVDAASDGDVVLVHAGTYAHVEIVGKSVTLQAAAGATVRILAGDCLGGCGWVPTPDIPCPVEVRDLASRHAGPPPCCVGDLFGEPGAGLFEAASVVFVDCLIRGGDAGSSFDFDCGAAGGDGVRAWGSSVVLHGGDVRGGTGGMWTCGSPGIGGAGVELTGGALFAAAATIEGGEGAPGILEPFLSCAHAGGPGIAATAAAVEVHGGSVRGGQAGAPVAVCAPALAGVAFALESSVLEHEPLAPERSIDVVSPLGEGAAATLAVTAPGSTALVVLGTAP